MIPGNNRITRRIAIVQPGLLLPVIVALLSLAAGGRQSATEPRPASEDSAHLAPSKTELDYFLPRHVYEFAEYLFHDGQYLRAAGEYQRYLILAERANGTFPYYSLRTPTESPDWRPPVSDSVLLLTGRSLRLGGVPRQAIPVLSKIARDARPGVWSDQANYEIAAAHFETGDYRKSLVSVRTVSDAAEFPARSRNLELLNLMLLRDWQEVQVLTQTATFDDATGLALLQVASDAHNLRRRSPVLAGTLSLVPGLGKVYAGRTFDGAFSMLLIGVTAWQAYEGFRRDGASSTRGWIYGSMSATFYIGNIWGSAVAASQHNARQEETLLQRALTVGSALFR